MPKIESPYVLDLEKYRREQLARFEEGIERAKSNLGEVFTGDKRVSDQEYARRSKRFLRDRAMELFAMQVFPIVRVQEKRTPTNAHDQRVLNEALLEFRGSSGHELYLDLEGRILTQYATVSIRDGYNRSAHISRDALTPLNDGQYRVFAGAALDALSRYAVSHAAKIAPMIPVSKSSGLLDLPEELPEAA